MPVTNLGGTGDGGLTPCELLREKGMRVTALRRQVLELLSEKRTPMSHSDVFESLAACGRRPDKVTLYRVLSAFAAARLVHIVQGLDGSARYCMHETSGPGCPGGHPHFLCRVCGRMICLGGQALPRVSVPKGMTVEGKQLLIFGRCARCADKKEPAA